jgi:hypothetical protein
LEKTAIKPNAAKRALSKLYLNSMWGTLTERNKGTKTKMICETREIYIFFATPGVEIVLLVFASDRAVWASWRFIEEENIPRLKHKNEVIEAFVTTGVPIHLYKYLE